MQCNFLEKLSPKVKEPRSFAIHCTIGPNYFEYSLYDLGASVNLMPLFAYKSLGLEKTKSKAISL